jgi:protein disulfide isomerase family A protein 5
MGGRHFIRFIDNDFFTKDGNVEELNPNTLQDNEQKIVMFFAPWCGFCKEMKPIYQKVWKSMSKRTGYAVNCEKYPELASKYGIEGFPTVMILPSKQKYPGDYDSVELETWVLAQLKRSIIQRMTGILQRSMTKSFAKELTPPELDEMDNQVVMFYAPWCGYCKLAKPIYEELANEIQKPLYLFNCEEFKSKAQEYRVDSFPTIGIVSKNAIVQTYDGPRTLEAMKEWVNSNNNQSRVKEGDFKHEVHCSVMFYSPSCSHCVTAKPIYDEVSMNTDIPCYKVNGSQHRELMSENGITGYPTFVWMKHGKKINEFNKARNKENMLEWIQENQNQNNLAII